MSKKWHAQCDPHSPREEEEEVADDDECLHHPLNPTTLEVIRKSSLYQNGQCKGDHHHPCNNQIIAAKSVANNNDELRSSRAAPALSECEDDGCAEEQTTLCGIGSLRPRRLQHLANKKVFLAVFCLASVLQGMYYTYFVSVLTTIEKLFQIPSKTTGIIMSATEMGQIGGALLLTYYGGHGHRPKWITCGMLLFAFASFLCTLPHFLYGSELSQQMLPNNSPLPGPTLCNLSSPTTTTETTTTENFFNMSPTSSYLNDMLSTDSQSDNQTSTSSAQSIKGSKCHDDDPDKRNHITSIVLGIVFISLLLIGIGSTAVYTLGIPYIDDNVANRDSPMYFAITIGVRILGPVFGFLLGSVCTMIYVNPFDEPLITNKDPKWIGAWWLGPFIVAAALLFVSTAMLSFPRRLPDQRIFIVNGHVPSAATTPSINTEANSTGSNSVLLTHNKSPLNSLGQKPSIRDFPATMRRLLKNEILLLRTASTVLHILPISGLYTFLPKYLESQFRLTATEANMTTGLAGILVMGVGIFASGTFMRRFKPKPRIVAAWIAVSALAFSLGMLVLTFVGCPITDFVGLQKGSEYLDFKSPCNKSCQCEDERFTPICTSTGEMYYSACYAGCKNYTITEIDSEKKFIYQQCDCLQTNMTAVSGYCPLECNNFAWFVCIFSLTVLVHSTSEVGSMLLTLRCVDPKDKAMALGLISFAIGLFGNVPCPIIYGVVVDSACIVWEYTCGRKGACWFYDPSLFRISFLGMTGAIMFLAFIVDAIVWYKATCIHFSDEDLPRSDESQPMNSYCTQFETTV